MDATDARRQPWNDDELRRSSTGACVERERERKSEGVRLGAKLGEGSEWARTPEKGSSTGDVGGKRAVVGASTMESASGRLGKGAVADRRGPQTNEGERANERSAGGR
jgi:hypothetical protein